MANARRNRPAQWFQAACPSAALLGDMVYIDGERTGDIYPVRRCDISAQYQRPAGMIVFKATSTSCLVQLFGEISDIYSGLTPGGHLFLGHGAGARLTHVFPGPATTTKLYSQLAGMALASDRLFLDIQEPIVLVP